VSSCFECGGEAHHDHHVVPRSRGGTKTVPLCEDCHGKAHERVMNIRALTKDALTRKKRASQRVGSIPYGKTLLGDGVTLVDNEGELRMVEMARGLRRDGLSLRDIADALLVAGYVNRQGRKLNHRAVLKMVRAA